MRTLNPAMMRRSTLVLAALLMLPVSAAAHEQVEYYGTDALGSIRIVFNPDGSVKGRTDYGPFGEELTPSLGQAVYAQLFRDGEIGLDYAEARLYQPRTGRLNAVDPVYAGLFEPQRWNRYAYALNNPSHFRIRPAKMSTPAALLRAAWTRSGQVSVNSGLGLTVGGMVAAGHQVLAIQGPVVLGGLTRTRLLAADHLAAAHPSAAARTVVDRSSIISRMHVMPAQSHSTQQG